MFGMVVFSWYLVDFNKRGNKCDEIIFISIFEFMCLWLCVWGREDINFFSYKKK